MLGSCANENFNTCMKVDVSDVIEEDEVPECIYADGNHFILSVGKRNGQTTGPLVDTNRLIINNFDNTANLVFNLNTNTYITQAIPYLNGIIYSTYVMEEELCKWKIIYDDGKNTTQLDQGVSNDCMNVPEFAAVNNKVCYLSVNKEGKSWTESVNVLNELSKEEIYSETLKKINEPRFISNGKKYCFISNVCGKPEYFIGDENGIKTRGEFSGKITSFGINDRYMAIGAVEESDDEDFPIMNLINLDNGNITKSDSDILAYRIAGSGDSFLCVDSEFSVYKLTEKTDEANWDYISKIGDYSFNCNPISFFSLGNNKYICEVIDSNSKDNKYEYLIIN